LLLAFAAYAVLAALILTTLSDPRIRGVSLAILGMWAIKTWVRRKDFLHPGDESGSDDKPM
jgi:hypothetical protein